MNINNFLNFLQNIYAKDLIVDDTTHSISFINKKGNRINFSVKNDYKIIKNFLQKLMDKPTTYSQDWKSTSVGNPVLPKNNDQKTYDLVEGAYDYGYWGKYKGNVGDIPQQIGKWGNEIWSHPSTLIPNKPLQDYQLDLRVRYPPLSDLSQIINNE